MVTASQGQLWPLRPARSQNRPGSYICQIRLPASVSVPFFPKKAWLTVCKTDPDPIWMAWSGSGQTQLFWKQAGVQESAGPVSGRTQPAPLPVSHFQTRFRSSTDVPDNILQNQPGSDLVLADCVRVLAKRIRSGSKPVCKTDPARFRPVLPRRSGTDANRIRHVYWE